MLNYDIWIFYEINYLMGACCVHKECISVERNNIIKQKNYDEENNFSQLSSCSDENECKINNKNELQNECSSGPILQLLIQKSHNKSIEKKDEDDT